MIWPRLLILRSLPLLLFNELLNWGIVTRCRYCRFHLNVAMSPALCPTTCNWAWGRLFLVFMFIFTVSVSNCIWEPFRGSKFNWKPCNLFLHTDVLWEQNSFDWTYIILIVVQIFLFLILNDGTTYTYKYSLVGKSHSNFTISCVYVQMGLYCCFGKWRKKQSQII